jgi:hypothetical protein
MTGIEFFAAGEHLKAAGAFTKALKLAQGDAEV